MSMSDLLDDEFVVSSYLNGTGQPKDNSVSPNISRSKVDEAIKWSEESLRTIILPASSIEELEDQWIKFNEMHKKLRRESDWKSLELFGITNQQHYESQRSTFLNQDIEGIYDNPKSVQFSDSTIVEGAIDIDGASSYYDNEVLNYGSLEIDKAIKWSHESNRIIIIPTRTLVELESLWDAYNSMIKKHRRESDWMSQELFGVTNLKHYEYLKSQFLKNDIALEDEDKYGSIIESSQFLTANYLKGSVKDIPLVDITKSLLEMKAPESSIYEELLSNNVISDVMDAYDGLSNNVPTIDIPYGDWPYYDPEDMIDMGVYGQAPEDNFYGVLADNTKLNEDISVSDWFKCYHVSSNGFYSEFTSLSSDWVNKVRELSYGLKALEESGDEQAVKARKQSLLELGWNPDLEFSYKTRIIAKEMAADRMSKLNSYTRIIDLREFRASANLNTFLNEETNASGLKPVFIVLTEGATAFSKTVKALTHTIYSHASIAFDSSLSKMYSFGIIGSQKGIAGGFIEEDVKKTPIGSRIGVYVLFVSDKVLNKIKAMVNSFKDNVSKTYFGYKNLVTYLFNIPYNSDWSLICSQFVDRCMKVAGIDITHTDSSLVAPADLDKAAKKDKRVYNIYEGLASDYNPSKMSNLLAGLRSKAKPIKEVNSVYYLNESNYIHGIISNIYDVSALLEMKDHLDIVKGKETRRILENLFDSLDIKPYAEAKEFPVQFDKDGNMLLKSIKKIDYEVEYAKSHKLLKQYKDNENLEGVKYEISKLWMMSCLIEERLHSKKLSKLPSEDTVAELNKAKAKILNDFQYYLKYAMEKEPSFNFTEYFESSPFSSTVTKVNATTILFISKLIKRFIKPL